MPVIAKGTCTGCGLCATGCLTGALIVSIADESGSYQITFQNDLCNGCRVCEKSCPENCLTLMRVPEKDVKGKAMIIIFQDKICRCSVCGNFLFPQAMVNRLKSKMSIPGQPQGPSDLCPFCRIQIQFEREMGRNIA
jgi:ferredoxin